MGVPVLFTGVKRIVDSAANLWYNWQVVGEAVVLKNSNRRCRRSSRFCENKSLGESLGVCFTRCMVEMVQPVSKTKLW